MIPPVAFPDTAGLEKSADGSEFIYGGSVAINRVLGLLRNIAGTAQHVDWRVYLINLFTLVDNVHHKDKTPQQIAADVETECTLLAHYIEAYAALTRPLPITPVIVFYIPDYHTLPLVVRRPASPGRLLVEQAYAQVRRQLPGQPTEIQRTPASVRLALPVGSTQLPHRDLRAWLSLHGPAFGYHPGHPVAMLSHCPLDLHLGRLTPKLMLLERYQGQIKGVQQFGSKLSVDSPHVPLTPHTHRLFGDKLQLSPHPALERKHKQTLLEMAEHHRWLQRTEQEILRDITDVVLIPAQEWQRVKF